jgi:hypothetical protein
MAWAEFLTEKVVDAMNLHLGIEARGHFNDEVPVVISCAGQVSASRVFFY